MTEIVKDYGMALADGFMHPFTLRPENDLYYDDDNVMQYFIYGVGSGFSSVAIVSGGIFLAAAWAGAVVPVKWRPLWSARFWNLNH